jgi:hypothetical protein
MLTFKPLSLRMNTLPTTDQAEAATAREAQPPNVPGAQLLVRLTRSHPGRLFRLFHLGRFAPWREFPFRDS